MMIRCTRRRMLVTLAAVTAAPTQSLAQPARPVRLVVPFPAGGTADALPRIVVNQMRLAFPNGIVVENRSGAAGNIGAAEVARADADGTTFLASSPPPIAVNHHLFRNLPFDPTKWVPVTVLATVPNVLAVRNGFPASNLQEFIAYVKANPGKVRFASAGSGSTQHLTAGLFMHLTGTDMAHIPYRGTAPALTDLVGGHVDVFFDNIASAAPFHVAGKIKVLAVADEQRSQTLPQVPTFIEQQPPAMQAVTFFAIVAPPGTPAAPVDYMHRNVAAALVNPEVKQRFLALGATPRGWTPAQTGSFIQRESAKWAQVIERANITLE